MSEPRSELKKLDVQKRNCKWETAWPDNGRPLSWKRSQIDILILEGGWIVCPWTQKPIRWQRESAIDHLIPISVLPINELWKLVPSIKRPVSLTRAPGKRRSVEA